MQVGWSATDCDAYWKYHAEDASLSTSYRTLNNDFTLDVSMTKLQKDELLSLENPQYKEILERYPHLNRVNMDDVDTKDMLPVQIILEPSDYAKIRTTENLRVGQTGEPVAEHTRFGWSLMSLGEDGKEALSCLAVNSVSVSDYDLAQPRI